MSKKGTSIDALIPTQLLGSSERPPVPEKETHARRFRFVFVFSQLLRLLPEHAWMQVTHRKYTPRQQERAVKRLQCLGMLWIRVAQALSMRSSFLSKAFGLKLMDLRDLGGAHPFRAVREVVEKELEQPLEEVFDEFEEKPFAATVVYQIHRARLKKEQAWTAVKVQKPLAEKIFDRDLKIFRRFTGLMRFFGIQRGMRWEELYHELKEIKVRELNYYYEATALETLERNLSGQPVYVPYVYRHYCRKRVLVMAFIQGALLSDIIQLRQKDPGRVEEWLNTNNIDLKRVGRRLFHSTYRQVFEDNFFHGDMHTSNIILLRDSNVAVIECRSAGSLEIESRDKQKMLLRALAEGEYVTAAEIYFLLASRLPRVDLNIVKEQLVRVWRIWETRVHISDLPYEHKSMAYMTGRLNRVVNDSHFAPLWSFTRLTCSWIHLDNALAALNPRLNYLRDLRIYFRHAERRENFDKLRRLPTRLGSSLTALHQVFKRTSEYTLFQETMMRRQAQVVTGSTSKLGALLAAAFGLFAYIFLVIGGFMGVVFSMRRFNLSLEPFIGSQLSWLAARIPVMNIGTWLVFLAALLFLYLFFRYQKRRFSEQEFGRSGSAALGLGG